MYVLLIWALLDRGFVEYLINLSSIGRSERGRVGAKISLHCFSGGATALSTRFYFVVDCGVCVFFFSFLFFSS